MDQILTILNHPVALWLVVALQFALGMLRPAAALATLFLCYVLKDISHVQWYLALASLLPGLWYAVRGRLILVPAHHYILVVGFGGQTHVRGPGSYWIFPWEWVDARLTQGAMLWTRQTHFVLNLGRTDDVENITLTVRLTEECDIHDVMPNLHTQLAMCEARVYEEIESQMPWIGDMNPDTAQTLGLPPHVTFCSLTATPIPIPEPDPPVAPAPAPTTPRGVRRRGSVGQKK
jgi:hypothetical protein